MEYETRNQRIRNSAIKPEISGLGIVLLGSFNPKMYPFKLHRQTRFEFLQKWRGVVLEVSDESFLARLVDMESPAPDEEAEILKREISDEDLQLIEPGAVFYWNIGYQVDPSGQRKRASVIRFRRLPIWTPKELSDAKRWAENTLSRLNIVE